ncbi:MAG: flavodoxin family protein [Deferrisomatales bacterium]
MNVLGISGSPIPNSNTDRAVQAVLGATGLDSEFIKLTRLQVAPCRACLGCVKTNRCVIPDDGIDLAEKVKAADAVVVGCYTPYSTIDSRTKAFLERLYPLRHQYGFLHGKPVAAVVTSAIPPATQGMPPAGDMGVNAVRFFALEEGMNFVGAVTQIGNVPCFRCGSESDCETSGLKMIHGPLATLDSVGANCFEESEVARAAAEALGRTIREALGAR